MYLLDKTWRHIGIRWYKLQGDIDTTDCADRHLLLLHGRPLPLLRHQRRLAGCQVRSCRGGASGWRLRGRQPTLQRLRHCRPQLLPGRLAAHQQLVLAVALCQQESQMCVSPGDDAVA